MVTIQQSTHDRMVREVADRYIRQGYPVQIGPSDGELPAFLQGYHPDLIVTTPEERIVVEVKSKDKERHFDYWNGLTKAIDAHPGWRLRLVIDSHREKELVGMEQAVLSGEEIEERLLAGQNLAQNGLMDSALIIAWSALEAVLREVSRAKGLQLPNQGPAPLITALYTEGPLEREEYDSLMQILQLRNQAAHGFHVEEIDRSLIDEIQRIVRRLTKQRRRIRLK